MHVRDALAEIVGHVITGLLLGITMGLVSTGVLAVAAFFLTRFSGSYVLSDALRSTPALICTAVLWGVLILYWSSKHWPNTLIFSRISWAITQSTVIFMITDAIL